MNWRNLRIGTKLYVGFGLILFFTLVISSINWIGQQKIKSEVDKKEDLTNIVVQLLECRRQEKNFVIRKDETSINAFAKNAANIDSLILATKSKYSNDEDKAKIDSIGSSATAYKKSFSEYVTTQKAIDDAMASMQESGRLISSEANNLLEKQYQTTTVYQFLVSFTGVRKDEQSIIVLNDPAYLQSHAEGLERSIELASKFNSSKNASNGSILTYIEDYKSKFTSFNSYREKQKDLDKAMIAEARAVLDKSNKAMLIQKQLMKEGMAKQISIIILIMLISLSAGIVISYLITRSIKEPVIIAREFAREIASGNLVVNIEMNQKDEIGELLAALQQMVSKIREVITNVQLGANNIESASQLMSSTSMQLSEGASEQASSVEELSSSMEEMVSNIQQNTENAQETEKKSLSASNSAEQIMTSTKESIEAIQNIAEKITIINDIAFQTNILALNAAVEAARAGEYGRGFAVVASEVRKLAERSKIAAEQISVLSKNSVKVTEDSTELLNVIIPEIKNTAKLVQEIAAATIEQNSGATQINNAIQQLNQGTQQNAAASEQLATTAEELASQAEQLTELVSFFSLDKKNKHHKTIVKKSDAGSHSGHKANAITQRPKPTVSSKISINTKLQEYTGKDRDYDTY